MPQATVVITSRQPAKRKRVCKRRIFIRGCSPLVHAFVSSPSSSESIALAFALERRRVDPQGPRRCLERGGSGYDTRDVLTLDFFERKILTECWGRRSTAHGVCRPVRAVFR